MLIIGNIKKHLFRALVLIPSLTLDNFQRWGKGGPEEQDNPFIEEVIFFSNDDTLEIGNWRELNVSDNLKKSMSCCIYIKIIETQPRELIFQVHDDKSERRPGW